jgi:hypothetical protein
MVPRAINDEIWLVMGEGGDIKIDGLGENLMECFICKEVSCEIVATEVQIPREVLNIHELDL